MKKGETISELLKRIEVENEIKRTESENAGLLDCPYDVDINGEYRTCHCNHENIEDCAGDI